MKDIKEMYDALHEGKVLEAIENSRFSGCKLYKDLNDVEHGPFVLKTKDGDLETANEAFMYTSNWKIEEGIKQEISPFKILLMVRRWDREGKERLVRETKFSNWRHPLQIDYFKSNKIECLEWTETNRITGKPIGLVRFFKEND